MFTITDALKELQRADKRKSRRLFLVHVWSTEGNYLDMCCSFHYTRKHADSTAKYWNDQKRFQAVVEGEWIR